MRQNWPHAPPHYFTQNGIYIITAATLHRRRLFYSKAKLNLFGDTTLEVAKNYQLILQAWAFFPNHYHLVVSFENSATTHRDFVRHLHRETGATAQSDRCRSRAASDVRILGYSPDI